MEKLILEKDLQEYIEMKKLLQQCKNGFKQKKNGKNCQVVKYMIM